MLTDQERKARRAESNRRYRAKNPDKVKEFNARHYAKNREAEQARSLAQEWLAEVRRGGDPSAAKAEARKAPTVAELCVKFMEDHSK